MWMNGCWNYYDCHKVRTVLVRFLYFQSVIRRRKFPYAAVRPSTLSKLLLDCVQFLTACVRTWLHTKPHISFQQRISILCWRGFDYLLLFFVWFLNQMPERNVWLENNHVRSHISSPKILGGKKINILPGHVHYLSSTKFNLTHVHKK